MNSIEKIRQEIERLRCESGPEHFDFYDLLDHFKEFIDSLPEESKVDVTDFCKPIDPGIAQCIADNWWEMLGEEEKPSEDVEEAAQEYAIPFNDTTYGCEYSYRGFIAGAKWQAKQFLKGSPFKKGIEKI